MLAFTWISHTEDSLIRRISVGQEVQPPLLPPSIPCLRPVSVWIVHKYRTLHRYGHIFTGNPTTPNSIIKGVLNGRVSRGFHSIVLW